MEEKVENGVVHRDIHVCTGAYIGQRGVHMNI